MNNPWKKIEPGFRDKALGVVILGAKGGIPGLWLGTGYSEPGEQSSAMPLPLSDYTHYMLASDLPPVPVEPVWDIDFQLSPLPDGSACGKFYDHASLENMRKALAADRERVAKLAWEQAHDRYCTRQIETKDVHPCSGLSGFPGYAEILRRSQRRT